MEIHLHHHVPVELTFVTMCRAFKVFPIAFHLVSMAFGSSGILIPSSYRHHTNKAPGEGSSWIPQPLLSLGLSPQPPPPHQESLHYSQSSKVPFAAREGPTGTGYARLEDRRQVIPIEDPRQVAPRGCGEHCFQRSVSPYYDHTATLGRSTTPIP